MYEITRSEVEVEAEVTGVDGQSRTSDEATDRCKLDMIRRWLNMAGLLSKAICGSFLQFFLTQVKFMVSSNLSLKSRLSKSWLLLKGMRKPRRLDR